jgi:DNA-directed RNA polymerase subunit RPC12/RpoP
MSNTFHEDEEETVFSHERDNFTHPSSSSSALMMDRPQSFYVVCPHCGYRWIRKKLSAKASIQCPNCLRRVKNSSAPRHELLKDDLHKAFESLKKKYPEFGSNLELARFISIHIIKSNLNSLNSDLFIQKFLELIKNHSSNT